jgi:hypothetical protein
LGAATSGVADALRECLPDLFILILKLSQEGVQIQIRGCDETIKIVSRQEHVIASQFHTAQTGKLAHCASYALFKGIDQVGRFYKK